MPNPVLCNLTKRERMNQKTVSHFAAVILPENSDVSLLPCSTINESSFTQVSVYLEQQFQMPCGLFVSCILGDFMILSYKDCGDKMLVILYVCLLLLCFFI
ncbi:hypothetical protein XENORESO_020831 [Xenotaenia resolanae]|uniref:Uncharacterized protein n=1 Tax=Xenotaenia resolanae TaxID=208358 RepID=A0ABV0WSA9_9TELE